MRKVYLFLSCCLVIFSCKKIDSLDDLSPNKDNVITTGADLQNTLSGSYVEWWNAIHGATPNLALLVAADAYGLSRGNFGTIELGKEPRKAYNNRLIAPTAIKEITEIPWYGCLSAVAAANDVINALDSGVGLDKGGTQDQSIRAAAHLVRGLSWGYLGLLFDKGVKVDEDTDLEKELSFVDYPEMIDASVEELEKAIDLAETLGIDFIHDYFNGILLNNEQFIALAHSYAARFLAQSARTKIELDNANWSAIFFHAERGLDFDFAPIANGKEWQSYQQYTFAETGKGPFWARVDQRIIATLDPTQPAYYPQVQANNEAPLNSKKANSNDARLESDFTFEDRIFFDPDKGEWHFSHYRYSRNLTDAAFEGNGIDMGKMPVFMKADNDLLKAEAALRLGELGESIRFINEGSRVTRGLLSPINNASASDLEEVIFYERNIELLGSAPFSLWLDRRRFANRTTKEEMQALGGLQIGTPAQLPVPAKELIIRKSTLYTFGGENDPEGITPVSL